MKTRKQRARGYTLIEVMVVLGILAIVLSLAAQNITSKKEALGVEGSYRQLRTAIERARSLATIAGDRIGTNRLQDCGGATPGQLWVTVISPTQIQVPSALVYNAGTDIMSVTCTTYNVTTMTNGVATITSPGAGTQFAFRANGRLVQSPGPNGAFIRLTDTIRTEIAYGVRFLPSGVSCAARDDFPAVSLRPCDEDTF